MADAKLPVVLLMGPTGAGKTQLSFELASEFPVEIVSVDSAMVYRGMDVGTAKPTPAERARVPHHLIDIRDPAESYSAGQFIRDARVAIDAVHAAGRVPLLVGGTMLYFNSLLRGLAELPGGDAAVRAQIDTQAASKGWPALHAELASVDPAAAARIHPNDPQRIQRALEVYRVTGVAISALQARKRSQLDAFHTLSLIVDIPERSALHERIERRLLAMMSDGFLEEVTRLRARTDLHVDMPAMRAVGYRQLWGHLDGAYGLDQGVARAAAATRQLAKRQLTWLRALASTNHSQRTQGLQSSVGSRSDMHWIDAGTTDAVRTATALVRTLAGPMIS